MACRIGREVGWRPRRNWLRKLKSEMVQKLPKRFCSQQLSLQDFPGSPVAETPHTQCRGPGFHSWSGNWIPKKKKKKNSHVAMKTWLGQINSTNKHIFFKVVSAILRMAKQKYERNLSLVASSSYWITETRDCLSLYFLLLIWPTYLIFQPLLLLGSREGWCEVRS